MLNFQTAVTIEMAGLFDRFQLYPLPVGFREVWLVGDGFAIAVVQDGDGIRLYYIDINIDELRRYDVTNTVALQFSATDRELYGEPVGIEDRVTATLRVYASGLIVHWAGMLSGDRGWLQKLQGKDAIAWKGELVDDEIAKFIRPKIHDLR